MIPLGSTFSRAYIDAETIKPIEPHLLPWLKADIRDTVDEQIPQAQKGLKRAQVELDEAQVKLAKTKVGTPDYLVIAKQIQFLATMVTINEGKLTFYDGKVYLLRKRLALSGGQS